MAYWQRRSNGRIFVYVFKDGKPNALPRKQVMQLDGEPDCNVDHWVNNYSRIIEKRPDKTPPPTDAQLNKYVADYLAYLASRKKAYSTLAYLRHALTYQIIPYFLNNEPPLKDPQQWPAKSIKLLEHLQNQKLSENQILRANTALRGFWQYFCDEGIIQNGLDIRIRRPVINQKVTPLKFTLTPGAVLDYVHKTADKELKLMALLGYFFSLRTQEIFALRKSDFRAGSQARDLECCRVLDRFQLYSKLSVHITRQRSCYAGVFSDPKSDSRGWVGCFDERAAKLIVELLNPYSNQISPLIRFLPDHNIKRWRKSGINGITLKDLRRASLYWLGHYTGMGVVELKNHARHSMIDTTSLYLRRPEEQLEQVDTLDLEG